MSNLSTFFDMESFNTDPQSLYSIMPNHKSCPSCGLLHIKRGPYCSRSCGNSRTYTPEQKLQKSLSYKNPTIHITQAELKELFDYDYINGGLLHRTECFNQYSIVYKNGQSRIGQSASWQDKSGYKRIVAANKTLQEHRMVYYWHTGEYPPLLDHIDRDKTNNRIENLRAVTQKENMANVDRSTWKKRSKST